MELPIQFRNALLAAGVSVQDVGLLNPGHSPDGWPIIERPDGVRVRLIGTPGHEVPAATAVVQGLDLGAQAQAEREAQDQREKAIALFQADPAHLGKVFRGLAATLVGEANALRRWLTSLKSAVATSTSLADLKARVATLDDLPDRNFEQVKDAVIDEISGM